MSGNVIDILAINETRLSNEISSDSVRIPGYEFIRKDRNRNGGGVGIYVKNTLNITERKDVDTGTIEALCIEVKKNQSESLRNFCQLQATGIARQSLFPNN